MTYEKLVNKVVKEENWLTDKQMVKFLVKLALLLVFVGLGLYVVIDLLISKLLGVLAFIVMIFLYTQLLNVTAENEESFKAVYKASKFWWLGLLADIAVFVVLVYFRFI